MWRCVTEIRVSLFVAHLAWCATEIFISVAHGQVRHKILIFVSRILWRTAHAPHNVLFGAPQMRLFLLERSYIRLMPAVRGDGKENEQLSAMNYELFAMIVSFDVKL
jgi:hypothetical protein